MKKLLLILFLLVPVMVRASTVVKATITVTNTAGTTNGQTLTVNSDVRTWTNAVYVPASQILTNSTATNAAQNLLLHLNTHPFTGLNLFSSTSNSVTIVTATDGASPTVSLSAGWGTVVLDTNTLGPGVVPHVPIENEPSAAQRTNIASGIGHMLNSYYNTNPITVLGGNVSGAVAQATHSTNADLSTYSVNSTNVSTPAGYASAADLVATNGVYFGTNAFASATNNLDMRKRIQFLSTIIPLSITGFANTSPIQERTAVLHVFNSTNIDLSVDWPAAVVTQDGSRTAVLTNGQWFKLTFSIVPGLLTNSEVIPLW